MGTNATVLGVLLQRNAVPPDPGELLSIVPAAGKVFHGSYSWRMIACIGRRDCVSEARQGLSIYFDHTLLSQLLDKRSKFDFVPFALTDTGCYFWRGVIGHYETLT